MSLPEIIQYTDRMDKEAKAIEKDVLRLSWHMRGAVSVDEAFMLSHEQQEAINEIIKENMEYTKETKMPFI